MKRVQNERRLLILQNTAGSKQADKTTQLQTCATSHEKETMAQRAEPKAERRAKSMKHKHESHTQLFSVIES